MWYTNIYSYMIVYQNYIVTSIKVGGATCSLYSSTGQKAEGVPILRNLVSTIGAQASPKKGDGTRCPEG